MAKIARRGEISASRTAMQPMAGAYAVRVGTFSLIESRR
jgi:hypothetical protein